MDDWKVRGKDYIIVLVDHYMDTHLDNNGKRSDLLKSRDLREIMSDLKDFQDTYIFFDMECINRAASRAFAFFKGKAILEKIVFFHVEKKSEVSENLSVDLGGMVEEGRTETICFSEQAKNKFQRTNVHAERQRQRILVLNKYVDRRVGFLSSSGIYSNMFLDFKKVFEDSQDFRFVIMELCHLVKQIESEKKIDYLVATSKNSIALTAVLSRRLDKPAIYHTNIGQKYVKQKFADKAESQTDNIQKKKRYLMIFDVICLGTEARILNAIINVCGGNLVGAAGLVCVQDLDMIRSLDEDSVLGKVRCLATAKDMDLGYRIALTREELEAK